MKNTLLALSLVLSVGQLVNAQDKAPAPAAGKPAAPADALSDTQKAVVGTYKSDNASAPTIVVKAQGAQLIVSATGFPDIPVTLTEKGTLTNPILPAGYTFTVIKDKNGNVTGLDVQTPQGGGVFAKQAEAKQPGKAEAPAVPDILGKYEAVEAGPVGFIEIRYENGNLIAAAEGQSPISFRLGPADEVLSPNLPDGATARFSRNGDKKVTGITIEVAGMSLKFDRKTFPAPPSAAPAAPKTFPDVLGRYEPDEAGPLGPIEVKVEKGTLISEVENQPTMAFKIGPNDEVQSPSLPEGVVAKFTRNGDKKVVGIQIEAQGTTLKFTRKTFPAPPAIEDPAAKAKAVTGVYTPTEPGAPVVTIKLKDSKLVLSADGFPDMEVTVGEKDVLKGDKVPEGFVLTLIRDKDGKVTGMKAETPMGDAEFTRAALPEEKTEDLKKVEPKPADAALARAEAAVGTYKGDVPGVPDVKFFVKDGKAFIEAEGYPAVEVTVDDQGKVTGSGLPEGFVLTLVRDKDGKVTGMAVSTPMGDIEMKRTAPAV